ncbi:hypothetical protein PLCT1_02319 [Planctomycetaceae bacterium]|nr:hypothetical protein PLCT1_02319 [Planctomycetaceae bacterium]
MILVAAMPTLINIGIGLAYFLGGRGKWPVAAAYITSLALTIVIAITIVRALKRPIDLDEQRGQLDWLDSMDGDERSLWRGVAARWLRQSAVLTVLGLVPVFSAITCTAAIIRTTRVLQIAHAVGVPPAYKRTAQIVRIAATIILGTYGAIATFLPFFAMRSAINPPIILRP